MITEWAEPGCCKLSCRPSWRSWGCWRARWGKTRGTRSWAASGSCWRWSSIVSASASSAPCSSSQRSSSSDASCTDDELHVNLTSRVDLSQNMRVGVSQVKPSNCFRRLEKLILYSIFDTDLSFLMMWYLQGYPITVLNERMWHLGGQNILCPILHIFRGVKNPNFPGSTPLFTTSALRCAQPYLSIRHQLFRTWTFLSPTLIEAVVSLVVKIVRCTRYQCMLFTSWPRLLFKVRPYVSSADKIDVHYQKYIIRVH